MKRHQQILAGVLALQIILSLITLWPRAAAMPSAEPVFPDLSVEDVVRLTLTDDAGNSVTLAREGAGWVLPDDDDYPANVATVNEALANILSLDTGALATETRASHAQLRVASDDFLRRIAFETADGATHTLYLGTAPRYTATHFRVEGRDAAYLTSALSTWELGAEARSWVDTGYVAIDGAEATEIVLENAQGTFTLVRDADNAWTLADLADDETIAAGKVGTVVRNATQVMLQSLLGKSPRAEYGLDSPLAVATVTTPAGTHTLEVGALDADGYVVKSSASDYYVRVAETDVSALVDYAREDFLQVETPPSP